MKVQTTNLSGQRTEAAELRLADDGHLWLDDARVQGVHIIGNRVALRVLGRQICVSGADYANIRRPSAAPQPQQRSKRR